jgi:hypothetical protein
MLCGQSKMANPEAQATFGHKTRNKGKKTTYKTKKMSNTNPTKITRGEPICAREEQAVSVSYKTFGCYTKSSPVKVRERGKN